MNKHICAVIVTFNRLSLLKECIAGLQKQTYPINKIIIVNNGSTDGTTEWLNSISNEKIEVIHQDNCGSSGGFHSAIKAGFEQGFEWVWMMDDDVEASPSCLENLIKYKDQSKCIHPFKKYKDGKDFLWEWFYNPYKGELIGLFNLSFEKGKDICFVNTGTFEGMLIHSDVIKKIGFPNKDYFIFGDDLEYGFLASLHTNVSYVKDAELIRKKNQKDEISGVMNYYYGIRNRHLLKKNSQKVFPNRKIGSEFALHTLKIYFKNILEILRNKQNLRKKLFLFFMLTRGLIDNYRKIVGKTI